MSICNFSLIVIIYSHWPKRNLPKAPKDNPEVLSLVWMLFWYLCSRAACLLAAATGQPERLRCEFRFELTWPLPLHPGVGHFRMVSCMARTRSTQKNQCVDYPIEITQTEQENTEKKGREMNWNENIHTHTLYLVPFGTRRILLRGF